MPGNLPPRLDAVLALLQPCTLLADVATDHGLLAVAAVTRGVAQRALATDLRSAPLQQAREAVAHEELEDVVATARGDGLVPVRGSSADAVVIAGLSGDVMVKMLQAGEDVLAHVTQVVLQANIRADVVRKWGRAHEWHLRDETMVAQRDRCYAVMAFVKGQGPDPAYQHAALDAETLEFLGPLLLKKRDVVARSDWARQAARLTKVVAKGGTAEAAALRMWQAGLREHDAARPQENTRTN